MDLSKGIKINSKFQITYGRLLIVLFVTTFQFLGMWCGNGWVMYPEMFFLFSNMFFSLSTQAEEQIESENKEK